MDLFPHLPLHLNLIGLFGLTLLLGLLGGELAKRSRFLPIITGYIIIGFLVGPGGFNLASASVLATTKTFIEISLSIILFELGRQLDFRWLRRDPGLLLMGFAESSFTFIAIFVFTYFFVHLSVLQSSIAATIAIATSPAVVMMVAHDLSSEGPVTRRTLILTSINNLISLILFTVLLPLTRANDSYFIAIGHSLYRFIGSALIGVLMFVVAKTLASFIGKNKENQFILSIGIILFATSLGYIFHCSTMLTLFILGVAARNFDRKHIWMEVDIGWLARIFFILLFVVAGTHMHLASMWGITSLIVVYILVRGFAKTFGILVFSRMSKLTIQQTFAISLALSPMAGVAIGMSNKISDYNPEFGAYLLSITTGVVAVLNLIGPILTQFAFVKSGETLFQNSQIKEIKHANTLSI